MISKLTENRFLSKFQKTEKGCWNWNGVVNIAGYGKLGNKYAHRVSWEFFNQKKIEAGLLVCHHCDNPSCVNPEHLFIGTQKDNMQDMYKKQRNVKPNNCGEKNPMFGKKHSENTKHKQSLAKKEKYKGSKHPRATINENIAKKIKEMRYLKMTVKQISEELKVSFNVVGNVVYGKSWK